MQKRKLNNKTLDAIGKKLFEREVLPHSDIDAVVSNPNLFALVVAKIEAEGKAPQRMEPAIPFFRRNALSFASVAAVVLFTIAAVSFFGPEKRPVVAKVVQIPDAVPEVVARPVFPPQGMNVGKLSAGHAPQDSIRAEKAVVIRRDDRTRRKPVNVEPEAEFYPVSWTGDPADTSGGHVIRTKLKRSSLFALGVNIPLENDEEMVKADLLVGSDGVTRAVRIVD